MNINPKAYETVKRHNIHGPCGQYNKSSPCMINGKCSKRYPKEFISSTTEDENGYPRYKRRDNIHFNIGKQKLNNSWVVPHNLFLSAKYVCQINVEICSKVKAVKYLCKYVYKGILNNFIF